MARRNKTEQNRLYIYVYSYIKMQVWLVYMFQNVFAEDAIKWAAYT